MTVVELNNYTTTMAITNNDRSSVAATTTKAESNGRQLPGRVLLFGLVSFVAIFLDFESSSLSSFQPTGQGDVSDFDAQQSAVKKQTGDETFGRMQQYQLEKQWDDYTRRVNVTSMTTPVASSGPEEIVIEEEPRLNVSSAAATERKYNDSAAYLSNATVEEIIIEAANETEGESSTIMDESSNTNSSNSALKRSKPKVVEKEETIEIGSSDQCFMHNTKAWLEGKRLSNADYNLTDDFVYRQILIDNPLQHPDFFRNVASQTICHEESRFRNPLDEWDIQNEALIDEWEIRLMYLAIHHHNHVPAIPEARARQVCPRDGDSLNISSKMDYECPSAKYLVANIAPSGLGAAFRLGAVSTILMALATDRIAVFVNNFDNPPAGAKFLKPPAQLASCPRGDLQCFYLPTTPCTLLVEDVRNAPVLPEYDARDLRRQGILENATYVNARILITEPRLNPPKQWSIQAKIQDKIYGIVMTLIDGIRHSAPPEQVQVLEAAAARIKLDNATIAYDTNPNSTDYVYGSRYTRTAHAALMYLMRPNANYQQLSDEMVANIVPEDVDRSRSIGLPIRGSDKCTSESLCYGFDTYMKLATQTWEERGLSNAEGSKGEIFLTTEDRNVLKARTAYEGNESFPYRFIVNEKDVLQGSGKAKSFGGRADAIMLSSIVSMKLQLQSKYVFGNCCSNFHLMIFDMVNEGCGAVPDAQAMCLQEHPDPEFHICCGWTRSAECDRIHERNKEEVRRKEAESEALKTTGSNDTRV